MNWKSGESYEISGEESVVIAGLTWFARPLPGLVCWCTFCISGGSGAFKRHLDNMINKKWILLFGVASLMTACVKEREPAPDVVLLPEQLQIAPGSQAVLVGQAATFSAYFINDQGDTSTVAPTWTSLSPQAEINAQGRATGLAVGQARLVASYKGLSDTAYLSVAENPDALAQVQLGGPIEEVPIGSVLSLTATGASASGGIVPLGAVQYQVSDTSLVVALATPGAYRVKRAGVLTVQATASGVTSRPITIALARSGQFRGSQGHSGIGTGRVFVRNGRVNVRFLSDFSTPAGPDYRVYLSRVAEGSTVTQNGVQLAILTRFSGEQSYVAPANVNLYDYPYLVVHCQQYNVSVLTTQPQ